MTDNRKSGIALIAGSIGFIVTMAIHPVGRHGMTDAQIDGLATMAAIAHALAIGSLVVLVLGVFGLTRRLAARDRPTVEDRLAFAGLVVFGFAAVAIFIAAAVSGFIVPAIFHHMLRDTAEAAPMWRIVISAIFQINQAFAKIFTVAASLSIALWSIAALRHGGVGRRIALYGCVLAPLLVVLVSVGHLQMDVHGMTAVVIAQAIWFIGVGCQLARREVPLVAAGAQS